MFSCFCSCGSSSANRITSVAIPLSKQDKSVSELDKSTLSWQGASIAAHTLQLPHSTVNHNILVAPPKTQDSTSLTASPPSRITFSLLENQQEKIDIVHDLRNEKNGLKGILVQLRTNHSDTELLDISQPVEKLETELDALLDQAKYKGGIELSRFQQLVEFIKDNIVGSNTLRAKKLLNTEDDNFYLDMFDEFAENMLNTLNNVSLVHEFSLSRLLEKVHVMKSVEAKIKKLSLRILYKTPVCDTVKGDSLRLKRALINLVSNAVNFTQKGSIDISVAMGKQTSKGKLFRFEVKDSGIGIPSEKIDRLFKRYSQINEAGSLQYGQIGLGLSICKALVTAMNEGNNEKDEVIGVESELGQSSTFWFTVPLEVIAK